MYNLYHTLINKIIEVSVNCPFFLSRILILYTVKKKLRNLEKVELIYSIPQDIHFNVVSRKRMIRSDHS